jgi:hypothetical protein
VTCGLAVSSTIWFPLRLLGETNEALVTLRLHGTLPLDDLSCLLGCVALRELSLQGHSGHERKLRRTGPAPSPAAQAGPQRVQAAEGDIEPRTGHLLARAQLGAFRVMDLRGLEKLVALETLDVTDIRTEDLSILRQCPRLVTLSAQGDITALESIIHAAAPSLVDCRLHIDRPVRALDSRSLSCLRRSTVLKFRAWTMHRCKDSRRYRRWNGSTYLTHALTMCDRWQAAVR